MIKVRNLSKIYKLYSQPQDRLKEALHPFRKKYHHDFYALRNINFEVLKGETVGIIGQNGSGKSTLLKILTSVLTPSEGTYYVEGKVSSLLELGTGFNPDLSGLENVYFYGSILGFSRAEIDAKIDEILAFADIGEFIHQTVKTYSSGMYVRLAFAVAIQVDPDILIVDEALSVGDIKFQLKCFRKFAEFQKAGKTILFVTHDTGAVMNYCSRAIWLNDGGIKEIGSPEGVCKHYMSFMAYGEDTKSGTETINLDIIKKEEGMQCDENIKWQSVSDCESFGEGGAKITHVAFYKKETNENLKIVEGGENVCLSIKVDAKETIDNFIFGFIIKDNYGNPITGMNTYWIDRHLKIEKGSGFVGKFSFVAPKLKNGNYIIMTSVAEGTQLENVQHSWVHDAYEFSVRNENNASRIGFLLDIGDINFKLN